MDPGTRISAIAIAANLGLALAKFVFGTIAGSEALVADGFNSAGDVLATLIGLFGFRFAQRPADASHPFGHGNAESVSALAIGGILLATGVFVSIEGVRALIAGASAAPDLLALAVALGTAVVKSMLAITTRRVGRALNSPSLLASAADHQGDVVISFGVALGIIGARLGWPWLDPAAAVAVGLWITGLSWKPLKGAFGVLMDEAPKGVDTAAKAAAAQVTGVLTVDAARVHSLGSYYVVDLEITVSAQITVAAGHLIAHEVEERVLAQVEHVREVRVHVNPGPP